MENKNKFSKPKPDVKASIEKRWKIPKLDLVPPSDSHKVARGFNLDYARLKAVVTANAEKMDDVEGILELLPDLAIVIESVVANILSPKDLQEVKLNINVHKEAPAEIAEIIRTHFQTEFNLEARLAEILKKALYTKGSYIMMAIPPTAIRRLIHENSIALESLTDPLSLYDDLDKMWLPSLGLLKGGRTQGPSVSYALEALEESSRRLPDAPKGASIPTQPLRLVEITDNATCLLYPLIKQKRAHAHIQRALEIGYGIESVQEELPPESIYLNRSVRPLPSITFPEGQPEEEKFNPVILTLPPESVIPVHVPGEPKNHVGYYLVLDENNMPLHCTTSSNTFRELKDRLDQTMQNQNSMNSIGLGVTYSTHNARNGNQQAASQQIMDDYFKRFEEELVKAVSEGGGGQTVEISEPGELYRIMLFRQLQRQKTRLVYVPAQMLTYIAFNYTETGVGISLIEKTKLYSSFRAILMFAGIMAGVRGSINHRVMSVTVDDDDPDPQATVEQIINEYIALQASGIPYGRLNPLDIIDSLQKAGIQFKINGNPERFPQTEVDVSEKKSDITPPDQSLVDSLRDTHYAALWANPETISGAAGTDFATTLTTINLLQAKRVMEVQQAFTRFLSSFIRKYINLGGPLLEEITAKYMELKGKCTLTVKEIVDSVELTLPKVDTAAIKAQYDAYKDYVTFIEEAVEVYVSEAMIKDMLIGEHTNVAIEDVKSGILNLLKRQYLRSQNMLPELDALLTSSDSNVGDLLAQHNEVIINLVGEVLRHTRHSEHEDDIKSIEQDKELNPADTSTDEFGSDADSEISDDSMTSEEGLDNPDAGLGGDDLTSTDDMDDNLNMDLDDVTDPEDDNPDGDKKSTKKKIEDVDEEIEDPNQDPDDEDSADNDKTFDV